ncbi:MAG: geranylgeranylglyceryl/heptaprenylglyceryl phosphate synthase [Bacteroidota bacterium]|jgi:putative glycerol-1-phosphate prenyltransferase|nr:geranylgeranylglyceryl/heptaprenylglyceryl phosphate synthase [Flavobacteriales bacterium]MEC7478091.1 geranylgeranylglyceryl/heptaprenylglyceryl phosphate synthase [Bacteroidota bacterium]MEC8362376.1 geranylgeranylglyceryl/heptaprenylglyceryl phosphate synthase [Bacteroidota bacterium]MEC8400469.1 geranylgeranylglyceryl/heptaprenylglyceryl phosphate synthase [Bacteroidota bacterium]MED5318769.1 geranylgeranylglyceryl/heptaprenylglyceryl phosphate synthase [Bacteroidota bacterium]|tara:strand:+ start:756 stop:1505 length:750 start_codon:yes stop_codon:yes gene_type:complete
MRPEDSFTWLDSLVEDAAARRRRLAVLVDPEDAPSGKAWLNLLNHIQSSDATDVFVGGSLVTDDSTSRVVQELKRVLSLPVVLFPGAPNQISGHADAMLFLSLISGRNPDLLIGRHVEAAPHLAKLQLETVPTGYMLIGDPPLTAAAYMSHSLPIPLAKPELAVATALAGEMLGLRCLYLDAGSGAGTPLPTETIGAIRDAVKLPLIVGGGLMCQEDLDRAWGAGATCVVVGSAVEREPAVLNEMRLTR